MRTERSRSYSTSSGVTSLSGHALFSPPASINPEPAYVANSAASQLVSSELETDGVTVSPSALAQLNSFLDHILFNILLAAKSTRLSLLRPAIHNVLKPRLGKPALSGADEELREYLGDDEEDDENPETSLEQGTKYDFDLELAWKLARLRCMVYSRLGDLEEDDEDEYIECENLDERGGRPRRFSSHPSRVTTASAIFLTSVIEFLAQEALARAAQVTQRKLQTDSGGTVDPNAALLSRQDRIVVSDADMRHLGRDSPLQKLWRGWRHQVRTSNDPTSRPLSPESFMVPGHNSSKASMSTSDNIPEPEVRHQPSVAEVLHENDPARIPLPMTDNDVNEIEVGSTHGDSDHDRSGRPRSLQLFPSSLTPQTLGSRDDELGSAAAISARTTISKRRSNSLPTSPALTLHARLGSLAVRNSDHAGIEPDIQARTTEPRHEASQSSLPSSSTSQRSTGREIKTGPFTATDAMPGTFPQGDTPNNTEVGKKVDMSLCNEDDGLSKSPVMSLTEPNLQHGVSSISPMAQGAHGSTIVEPTVPIRAHSPRASSKAAGDFSLYNEQHSPTHLGTFRPAPDAAPGNFEGPPLAPLWETRETASVLPAENSPVTPTTDAQDCCSEIITAPGFNEVRTRNSSKSSHNTKGSSSSSKRLGFDREQQSAMQVDSDRASVQRVYSVPNIQQVNGQAPRPSTSHSTKEKRPGTGSSRMSSLKNGSLGRASLDTAVDTGGAQKRSVEHNEKKQSLDKLIQSKETLKYTLTPENMRVIEAPDSPRHKTQTQELADVFRDTAPPGDVKPREAENKLRSSVEGVNGLRANPPGSIVIPPRTPVAAGASQLNKMQPQSPSSPVIKSIRSQYQPRDAKVYKASTRDLADFAKVTGPEDPGQLPKVVSQISVQPKQAKTAAPRFLARDPVVKGASSDLIDFIREGPPLVKSEGTHRIPRAVAPFRTTMDSDELNALGPPRDPADRNSGSSNQDGSTVTKSTVNSRTGLMDSTNRTAINPANSSNLGASQISNQDSRETTQPKRKQVRVRDPYAIEFGSDDEIFDGLSKPPKYEEKYEESLIDFLRNTSPAPENQFQPQPLLLSKNHAATQAPNLLRKPVSGGFRERLKRTASTNSLGRTGGARNLFLPSDPSPTSTRSGNQLRTSSPHLVPSGSRIDSYKPTQTTYASHVERNRQRGTAQGPDEDKDEGSLSRFFSRKRRVAA